MIARLTDTWGALPTWAKWTTGIAAVVLFDAATTASHERDFFAGLAEHSVAIVLRYAVMGAGLAAGIWLGMIIAKRTRAWIGVVAGIVIAAGVWMVADGAAKSIPGVGWRMQAMQDSSCHTEWDGRSNPVECD